MKTFFIVKVGAIAGRVKGIAVATVVALGLLSSSGVYAETITIAGSSNALDGIMRPLQGAFETGSGISLKLVEGVFPETYQDLSSGAIDGYLTASEFQDAIDLITRERGTPLDDDQKKELRTTEVARVPLAVFVNQENPLRKINHDQLAAIFAGQVDNWKSLAGQNLVIRPLILSGYVSPLRYQLLSGAELGQKVLLRETPREVKVEAISYKNILAVLPDTSFLRGLKKVEGPELVKRAMVITKGEPSPKVKKLVEFLRSRKLTDLR